MTDSSHACAEQLDPRGLRRDGTDQVRRAAQRPDPSHVPVDQRRAEHALVFASAYARHLRYFDLDNTARGDWQQFFAADETARLATAAVADHASFRRTVKALLRSLEDAEPSTADQALTAALGALFDLLGTAALRVDALKESMGPEQPLRATLGNLIRSSLGQALRDLLGYYRAGEALGAVDAALPPDAAASALGEPVVPFRTLAAGAALSSDWPAAVDLDTWADFVAVDPAPYRVTYGAGPLPDQLNNLASHNLFRAVCDTFVVVHTRVVEEAIAALRVPTTGHAPHNTLFLAFLALLDRAREQANALSAAHLDFYYRRVLQLQPRPALPGRAHLLATLAKHVSEHEIPTGARLKAGKDDQGTELFYEVERSLVANRAVVVERRRTYRHPAKAAPLPADAGRQFASLVPPAGSWHPFVEQRFSNGALEAIEATKATVGFAVASRLLWLAGGTRTITLDLQVTGLAADAKLDADDLACELTAENGWHKAIPELKIESDRIMLSIKLTGGDPPITPYDPKVHDAGHPYGFDTALPVLTVRIRHRDTVWRYDTLESLLLTRLQLAVDVQGLRTLSASNDLGSIDTSKPFLPWGPSPATGASLVVGSKEVFAKSPTSLVVRSRQRSLHPLTELLTRFKLAKADEPAVQIAQLVNGTWVATAHPLGLLSPDSPSYVANLKATAAEDFDLAPDVPYTATSRDGYVRLQLTKGLDFEKYPAKLAGWARDPSCDPPTPPVPPSFETLELEYRATADVNVTGDGPASDRSGRFFHITPFGRSEPHGKHRTVLPRFRAGTTETEGELYLGIEGLKPPQNLSLLFQLEEGTANPLLKKPEHHLHWSYLRGDEWEEFDPGRVTDGTNELLGTGIVTLAVPADADTRHAVLPAGLHWIRVAVAKAVDAVCRVEAVTAQAFAAVAVEAAAAQGPRPGGTITKLSPPDPAVKSIAQPSATFGGRPTEDAAHFALRASERLRHKNRAIALWDIEHLVLDAFPTIYQARCLNHTQYEPAANGVGTYRELAPGHITVVTIPDLAGPDPRDPYRPATSLRLLKAIKAHLAQRVTCFAQLHVHNPQFERVRVQLGVRLRGDADESFHVVTLQREISELLSPWATRREARPSFNGVLHRSRLIQFVESRPYVDYVRDVKLFHLVPGAAEQERTETVSPSRAISILVSAPPELHVVTPIHAQVQAAPEVCACLPGTSS